MGLRAQRRIPIGGSGLPPGDCPTFFPLPPPTPGSEGARADAQASGKLPTHVYKAGARLVPAGFPKKNRHDDVAVLGTWEEGAPKVPGKWTPMGPPLGRPLDNGEMHASKDLCDA